MVIVIDTNILVAAIGKKSPYRPIMDALLAAKFTPAISNEILEEYTEVLTLRTSKEVSENFIRFLLNLPKLKLVHPTYRWELIIADPDDNKFVDCAVAAQADYIVSNDKHFNVLKSIAFPKLKVIDALAFLEILRQLPSQH
jgi:putative PIN family toxin of toxin-antitoxin system